MVQGARRGRRRRVPPARRRKSISSCSRGSRSRLPRPRARHVRLLGDGLVSRARASSSASSTSRPAPILLGRHLLELGLKPGPRVGEILKAVYELQMDGTVTTTLATTRMASAASSRDRSTDLRAASPTRLQVTIPAWLIHTRLRRSTHSRRITERRDRLDADARRRHDRPRHASRYRRHDPAAAPRDRLQLRRILRIIAGSGEGDVEEFGD